MTAKHAVHALLLSSAAMLAGGAAAQTRTLRMPVYGSPGQLWMDQGGELQGVRVKVLKELNNRLAKDKIELKYVTSPEGQLPIARAMKDILDGRYEAYFGLIYSKAREDEGFVFGKEEIYSIPTVVWTRTNNRFTYAGLSSLKGKKIGLVIGYPFLDDVKNPDFTVDRTAPDDEVNVQKLLSGKVDAIIDNLTRTGTAVVRLKATDKITYSKEPFENSRFLVAYNRTVPADVVAKVDAALKGMRDGGVIKRILDEAVYGPLKK
jgi:ABC-type amino acid transport substrate-binding protein